MSGLANDFVADRAADAAIAGFMKMGAVKGTAAVVGTPVIAGAITVAALAAPVMLFVGVVCLLDALTSD